MITFIFISVVGSLMVSYAKARAEGLGLECKTGLLARPERVIILALGLLTDTGIWALALLAIFSNVTAVERIISVWRMTRQTAGEPKSEVYEVHPFTTRQDTGSDNRELSIAVGTNEPRDTDARLLPTSVPPFTGSSIKNEETA
jgi:CDP-diacylglycerol--glycerol-3-phosphate 3-phosphatidyltransferase